jgi:hypothetical protein
MAFIVNIHLIKVIATLKISKNGFIRHYQRFYQRFYGCFSETPARV